MSAIALLTRFLPIVFLFTGQLLASNVSLAWTANTETDLAGYWVYRTLTPGANYVRLNSSVVTSPSFVDATAVAGTTYYYAVTATNTSGLESGKSTEVQAIVPAATNNPPIAYAGADQTAAPGTPVTLTGSGTDPNGDALIYSWSQVGGPAVSLNGASTPTVSFTAPSVAAETILVFRLTVKDGVGGTATDDANVTVLTTYRFLTDFTTVGSLGVGTDSPQRAVHLVGPNAVFRMDRSADTAAFLLVRTDLSGNPLKSFVVGANASGPNTGEFIIDDIGAAVGGAGQRRMTIANTGDTTFGGTVTGTSFVPTSSLRFKTNLRPLENPLGKVKDLAGVRFDWKTTGRSALGVIAERVARVLPEGVSRQRGTGLLEGVNYDSLVALLLESSKAQGQQIDALRARREQLRRLLEELAKSNQRLEERAKP